jgi:UDP-N-acetylglucosamine acyltransferase
VNQPLVHPTAIIAPGAQLGRGVKVGPYSIVGDHVVLGDEVELVSHAVVEGHTRIGAGTRIFPFASIGHEPQDRKYHGEASRVEIGERSVIRESVTVNPGTEAGGMLTRIGDDCLIMACAHVAHDVIIGNNVVMANYTGLAGHVHVGNHVTIGGTCVIHQRTRIGDYAFIGAQSMVDADVIPYGMAVGNRARLTGLNVVGLKRHDFDRDAIHQLRQAYRAIFKGPGTLRDRIELATTTFGGHANLGLLLDFLNAPTDRPVMLPRGVSDDE